MPFTYANIMQTAFPRPPSKTLAKLAHEIAKKHAAYAGVLDLTALRDQEVDQLLEALPVDDVWGIGAQYAHWLRSQDIFTAKGLKYADETWIRKHLFRSLMQRQNRNCPAARLMKI